jgi:competence protein ComEC
MIMAAACFAVGILADRLFDLPAIGILLVGSLAWLGWLVLLRLAPRKSRLACILLFLMISSSGMLWHHARWNWFPANEIGFIAQAGKQVHAIRGVLTSEPVRVAAAPAHPTLDTMKPKDRVRFLVKVDSIRDGGNWISATGYTRASVFLTEQQTAGHESVKLPVFGQRVEIVGDLVGASNTKNPGQFDFQNHFRAKGQLASVFVDTTDGILTLGNAVPAANLGFRARARAYIDEQLHLHLAEDQAAFASAVLLGNRDQMDFDVRQRFLKTGASHLLAISGLHVGILASGFLLLLRLGFVSRRNCLYLTIVFVLSYAWLVEFRPTVLRASILICVMCGARLLGKTALSWGSLTTALMLVLIVNPNDLFSLGAQLSFLAISTIIIGKPWIFRPGSQEPLDQLIARTRSDPVRLLNQFSRNMRAAFCVSFLIWALGLPLVAHHFHSIALVAPLINPLLLIPMAFALYAGIVTIACGSIAPWLAIIPAAVCGFSLGMIQFIIDVGAAQTASHFWSNGPSTLAVGVFYLGMFLFAVFPKTKVSARWCIVLGFGWLVFGWLVPDRIARLTESNKARLQVTVIDVRHGSATLVKLPQGENILFDCGSLSGSNRASDTISNVLWQDGIDRLDAIVVSHADVDHFNGLPELLDRFQVDSVWIGQSMQDSDAESVQTFRESVKRHRIPVKLIGAGTTIRIGKDAECTIDILGPPSLPDVISSKFGDNELSLIASLRWNSRHILLPGDVEGLGLESLLKWPIEKVDLLVAAHHGSKNSGPERFARWCQPDWVVASCGSGRFGVAESTAFQRGHECMVLTTDRYGAIRCEVDASGAFEVGHWDGDNWNWLSHL